mmetsp:Transcript_5238/g.14858  ORF Transcript_5238/g.14858 Transcript_5238/m.14858 type:complete len:260 (+) Transcript_5238:419-1198(+)
MREVHRHLMVILLDRRRAMATDRPLITCRPMADMLRRDTATDRRRLMDITIPLRTTGVRRRRSTFFAMDAAAEPALRRTGTITVLLRRECREKMERRNLRLRRRVPRAAEVAGATETTGDRTQTTMPTVRSRMPAVAVVAVARRLRPLTVIIPHITVAHRRDTPAEGVRTEVTTVDRLLAIMLPMATVRLRRMAIRLTIRMGATVRPIPVTVVDRRMTDMAILGLTSWVAMAAAAVAFLVPIQPSASPSAVVQKGVTRQ